VNPEIRVRTMSHPATPGVLILTAVFALAATPLGAQQAVQFEASDGHQVHAYRYVGPEDGDRTRPLILAFNQGGADARSEYGPIVPRLLAAGFDVLAVDARAGGTRFGGENRTVAEWGGARPYCEAQADIEGALAYARGERSGPIILWGSSFSAALVLRVAAEHEVAAVLAFSPASGGPLAECRGEDVSDRITAPVLVLRPANEAEIAADQLQQFREQGHQVFVAQPGTHGSSMLVDTRVDGSVDATWDRVLAFLSESVEP